MKAMEQQKNNHGVSVDFRKWYNNYRYGTENPQLRDHMCATYITLRFGTGVLGLALPFILLVGGAVLFDIPLQKSMSAYYYSSGGDMRDILVGILFAIGVFLFLYKGFTTIEDLALDIAGILLVLVALFPVDKYAIHDISAVLFFFTIAYVCIFRASDTLELIQDINKRGCYKCIYRSLGLGMIISPVAVVILAFVLEPNSDKRVTIFFIEAVGVLIFGSYWIIKGQEIIKSKADRFVLEGKLAKREGHRLKDLFSTLPVHYVQAPGPATLTQGQGTSKQEAVTPKKMFE